MAENPNNRNMLLLLVVVAAGTGSGTSLVTNGTESVDILILQDQVDSMKGSISSLEAQVNEHRLMLGHTALSNRVDKIETTLTERDCAFGQILLADYRHSMELLALAINYDREIDHITFDFDSILPGCKL